MQGWIRIIRNGYYDPPENARICPRCKEKATGFRNGEEIFPTFECNICHCKWQWIPEKPDDK